MSDTYVRGHNGNKRLIDSQLVGSVVAIPVSVLDANGSQVTSFGGTGTQYAEDAAHASGDTGTLVLAVRQDTATQLAGTDGDYTPLISDANGRLHCNVGAALPAGTNNIGDVDVLTIAAGDNNIGNVDIVTLPSVTIGTFPDNEPFNAAQWGGTAVAGGSGASTAGSPRVIASTDSPEVTSLGVMDDWDNAASDGASVSGDVAHDSPDAGEPAKIGGIARQTNPTAVADADRTNATFDDLGRQVVILNHVRDLVTQATTTISDTVETTILSAGAAGVFHDLTMLWVTNSSATAVRVDFRDATAGTIRFSLAIAANGGAVPPIMVPITQTTSANAWTAQLSASVTDIRIFVQGVKNV